MKTFRLLATVLLVALCTGFYSCSKETDSVIDEPQSNIPKTYTVSLSLGGDFISTSETPLGRVEETLKKIYGINVYIKKDGEKDYIHHAYGLFDNIGDMTISLSTGYRYKFECTVVKDDKDILYCKDNMYSTPFEKGNDPSSIPLTYTLLENKFISSPTAYYGLSYLYRGEANVMKDGNMMGMSYPRLDRYYGELNDYAPSSNEKITINLKRTVFGLKFVVVPPLEGTLVITQYGNERDEFARVSAGEETYESESIYTIKGINLCMMDPDYEEPLTFKIAWNKPNSTTQTFNKTIAVKRNVMTTINVDMTSENTNASLGFNEENVPMGDVTVDINGGSQYVTSLIGKWRIDSYDLNGKVQEWDGYPFFVITDTYFYFTDNKGALKSDYCTYTFDKNRGIMYGNYVNQSTSWDITVLRKSTSRIDFQWNEDGISDKKSTIHCSKILY